MWFSKLIQRNKSVAENKENNNKQTETKLIKHHMQVRNTHYSNNCIKVKKRVREGGRSAELYLANKGGLVCQQQQQQTTDR